MTERERRTRAGTFWAAFPVILIVAMLTGLGSMAYIAVDDPAFAVEKDYYKKAVHWDEIQAQNTENARLGWKVSLETHPNGRSLELVLTVADGQGHRINDANVEVEAFPNARASEIVSAHFARQADGVQRTSVPLSRPGLWEFRFGVEARGRRFTQVVRQDVAAGETL